MGDESQRELVKDRIRAAEKMHKLEQTQVAEWSFFVEDPTKAPFEGLLMQITLHGRISSFALHARGDFYATVCPKAAQNNQVIVHSMSKGISHRPFTKSKSNVQKVMFHGLKPWMFIVTQSNIWIFDLAKQAMIKKLVSGAKWYSSIDLHKEGDNIICGTYDRRLIWYD